MYYSSPNSIYVAAELKCQYEYLRLKRFVHQNSIERHRIADADSLRRINHDSTHKICHIIGSGTSVVKSYKSIDSLNDFVIGFNYAGLLPLYFDVYFIEAASDREQLLTSSLIHEQLFFHMCQRREPKIFVKCMWETDWWSSSFIQSRYEGKLGVIIDVIPNLPILANSQALNLANQKLFRKKRSRFFLNGASSAVFSVLLAYQLGFRNIVVHGVDYVGPHFFHSNEFSGDNDLIQQIRELCPQVTDDFVHGAGKWMSLQWPHVIRALAMSGVTIYSGSQSSLFSTYAPVYIPYTQSQ
jgi:hypothetical protein